MARKPPPNLPYVHGDYADMPSRIAAFGNASYAHQVNTFAHLRIRSESHKYDAWLAGSGLALAYGTWVVGNAVSAIPKPDQTFLDSAKAWWISQPWLSFVLLGFTIVAVAVTARAIVQFIRYGAFYKTRARVWLAAYEEELARRNSARGAEADAWRSSRPIDWGHYAAQFDRGQTKG